MKSRLYKKRGFTLIELLLVVAVISVFSTFAIISYGSVRKTGRDTKRKAELKQYQTAVEVYGVKHDNTYPVHSTSLTISKSSNTLCTELGLSSCPEDPQTGTRDYMYQSNVAGTIYVLWAELEGEEIAGSLNYFVLCSNGTSGISVDADMPPPSGGVCPPLN